jgi:hypothetical protein
LNWHPADLRGRDAKAYFAPKPVEYKGPVGRPRKLRAEILECKRGGAWVWSDHVSVEEAWAGDQFYSDWRASGLEPVQAQQLREGDCSTQARTGSTEWSKDDLESYDPPGSTVGMPKSGAVVADGAVVRTYEGNTRGTLHIVFNEPDPDDKIHDAVDRVERDLERRGALDERNPEAINYWRRKPQPKRMSAETVARLNREFEERTGRTDHHVPPKRRKRKGARTPGISNGMKPLVDPEEKLRRVAARRRGRSTPDRMAAGAQSRRARGRGFGRECRLLRPQPAGDMAGVNAQGQGCAGQAGRALRPGQAGCALPPAGLSAKARRAHSEGRGEGKQMATIQFTMPSLEERS